MFHSCFNEYAFDDIIKKEAAFMLKMMIRMDDGLIFWRENILRH